MRWRTAGPAIAVSVLMGCATTVPYVGQGPHPQIERGRPNIVIDTLGNILAIWPKILLLDSRFANHAISAHTESYVVRFLDDHPKEVGHVVVRLNQYAPHKDLYRLITNHQVAWPWRATLGLLSTLIGEVLLPGRILPFGDHYNPWTDTVQLYSDHPAVSLHELGHAYDFGKRRFKGTYAFIRAVPFVDLYQEAEASGTAIDYLIQIQDREAELEAYKILTPAYGSYIGRYLLGPFNFVAIGVGHLFGQGVALYRGHRYQQEDTLPASTVTPEKPAPSSPPAPNPTVPLPEAHTSSPKPQ